MRWLAVVAVVALVAACSSGGTAPSSARPVSLPMLCGKLGHTFVETTDEHELFTADQGHCGPLTLYAFTDQAARDNWLKAAATFGTASLVGDRWVVTADDPAQLDAAQQAVGGDRR